MVAADRGGQGGAGPADGRQADGCRAEWLPDASPAARRWAATGAPSGGAHVEGPVAATDGWLLLLRPASHHRTGQYPVSAAMGVVLDTEAYRSSGVSEHAARPDSKIVPAQGQRRTRLCHIAACPPLRIAVLHRSRSVHGVSSNIRTGSVAISGLYGCRTLVAGEVLGRIDVGELFGRSGKRNCGRTGNKAAGALVATEGG